jgi:hypothetical protein
LLQEEVTSHVLPVAIRGKAMFMEIDELRKHVPAAKSMEEYVASLKEDEIVVVLRNYDEPTTPPCLEDGVEIFDFEKNPRPVEDITNAYGTKPNVPGINVVNAIKAALGPGGYAVHTSDGSYTGYSIWELQEFIKNFDNTNLRVWIAESFDCDDFSQVLQGHVNGFFPGIAFGTIWYGPKNPPWWGHSVNLFYSYTQNRVYLVEPQSNAFYSFDKNKWKAWMVII